MSRSVAEKVTGRRRPTAARWTGSGWCSAAPPRSARGPAPSCSAARSMVSFMRSSGYEAVRLRSAWANRARLRQAMEQGPARVAETTGSGRGGARRRHRASGDDVGGQAGPRAARSRRAARASSSSAGRCGSGRGWARPSSASTAAPRSSCSTRSCRQARAQWPARRRWSPVRRRSSAPRKRDSSGRVANRSRKNSKRRLPVKRRWRLSSAHAPVSGQGCRREWSTGAVT